MKLYFSSGACSLSPHIALLEAGIPFTLESVDLRTGKYSGGDFTKISPKGYVPALVLDSGEVLTEGVAIVQYIAEKKPEAKLMPAPGTLERARCMEWLTFTATELHKGCFSPLWSSTITPEVKAQTMDTLGKRIDWVNTQLKGRDYLLGTQFTVADAYMFTVLSWSDYLKIDLKTWPNVVAFMDRVKKRPKVQEALKAEGIAG
jgi:glutathione S-transferase